MDREVVTAVVRQLHADGQKATARAVLERTGGSMRDVHRFLREAREFLDDAEVAELLETELPIPAPPALGQIVETFQAAQQATDDMGTIAAKMEDAKARLDDLALNRPLLPTDPQEIEDWVHTKRVWTEEVATVGEIITRLNGLYLQRQSEGIAFRSHGNQLQRRVDEIRMALSSCTRDIAEAEESLALLLRDQEHYRKLTERRVATAHATKRRYEADLRNLVGDR